MGMDWLGPNEAMIDCENQLVRYRAPGGSEQVIHGEGGHYGSTLYSATRARRYLQHGSSRFLAYVMDTRVSVGGDGYGRYVYCSGVPRCVSRGFTGSTS